ncbi:hypothetical protein Micbo1qcDRAFT_190754 [Microdochium bolleyi]|uniref:RING-type E3 ubiquitin transferase n=1 Tax=Microdochium bolleyi TaxID=196109 RepID=A0A136ILS6_9PEZI|nr:hypothetical protein Micbo1qcDRAFT_190754 [Microdochium bolleyi]
MSEPLSAEDERHYTQIIDGILSSVDLETVTRKKIRSSLEAALGGKDLSDQKHAIKELIEQRFDAISNDAQPDEASPQPSPKRPANGYDDNDDDADGDEIRVSSAPPKKKQRKEKSEGTEDADAKLAAMLQAEENSRSRATRGGGAKAKVVKKKAAPRKKSAKRVGPDDDSDVDGSDAPPKRKAGGGFTKPFNLSEALSDVCGETRLPRTQVVSKLWEYIKANELQDPADKRQIMCDDKLNAIFKTGRISMFQMNKHIGNHLYPVAELTYCHEHGKESSVIHTSGESTARAEPEESLSGRTPLSALSSSVAQPGSTKLPMEAPSAPAAQTGGGRPPNARGRGGRGRGRGGNAGGNNNNNSRSGRGGSRSQPKGSSEDKKDSAATDVDPATLPKAPVTIPAAEGTEGEDDVEAEVCFICASPVIHQSVAPCNHRTCHICSLRMRALYKSKECAHCRTLAPFVIFTDDGTKRYEDYADADISTTDDNIGIRYAKEDIVGDTVLLLRYNCPEASCDFAGLGWPNLHKHVRSTHNKKMCDLCTRNKKVFTHEHELFTDKELEKHMRHGDDRPGAVDQTGFKGHPLCAFCGSRFYDADKLYEHCREKHERCFLCDRQDPRQPHYYRDYNSLEEHFRKDHFICLDRECLEKKFVVFASEMDLKAHQLAEHGTTLSKDVRRDARQVDISGFDFRQPYQEPTRGGRAGRGRGRDNRDGGGGEPTGRDGRRGRDPNAEPIPASSAQPLRRDELAFQRQMAIHSSQSVSTRTFGGQLSSSNPTPAAASGRGNAAASTNVPTAALDGLTISEANMTPEDRARQVRHGAVLERAANLLQNDQNKLNTFRNHISSYRQGKQTGTALIDAFFSLFTDTSASALGTLVREVADLFEDKGKADGLRKAWSDWRAINEDYPSLPGLGGMHGATTSSSGWASAASSTSAQQTPSAGTGNNQRHTTRVLKLKSSTQQSRRSSVGQAGGVLIPTTAASRPPPPATATSAFPALPASGAKRSNAPSVSAASRATANALWGVSNNSASYGGYGGAPSSSSSSSQQQQARPPPVRTTNRGGAGPDAFPALPAAPKPTTTIFGYGRGAVRRDFGGSGSQQGSGFSWGGGSGDASGSGSAPAGEDGGEEDGGAGKGKKGNKGRKKVLVQWG